MESAESEISKLAYSDPGIPRQACLYSSKFGLDMERHGLTLRVGEHGLKALLTPASA